ncbi:MAG: hypothetical protein ACYC4L_08755 [Chloroflexota bacterium]
MEVNFCAERIVEILPVFSPAEVQERALAKRPEAFGQVARFFQRPAADEIEVVAVQKRLEPFWHVVALATYQYERKASYRFDVPGEVEAVSLEGRRYDVQTSKGRYVEVEAFDHCLEEARRELLVDAVSGRDVDFRKYLGQQQQEAASLDALQGEGTVIIAPQVRSSSLARKAVGLLVRNFEADQVLEDRIDFESLVLYYRPIYAIEYLWASKQKRQVLELDGLTGETRAEGGRLEKQVAKSLDNDDLFDIGADTIGTLVPGANIAIKVGRLAARKVVR